VFLISDRDWNAVLRLIPVVIWTEVSGELRKYPVMVFHEESGGFDADSIINFIQQYGPERVTVVGETPPELDDLLIADPPFGAGLNKRVQRISEADFYSYWDSLDGKYKLI